MKKAGLFFLTVLVVSLAGCVRFPGQDPPEIDWDFPSEDSIADDLQPIVIIDGEGGSAIHLEDGYASYSTVEDTLSGIWRFMWGDKKTPHTGMEVVVTVQKKGEQPSTHTLTTNSYGIAEVKIKNPEKRVEYGFTLIKVDGRSLDSNETELKDYIKFQKIVYGTEFTLTDGKAAYFYDEFFPEIEFSWRIENPPDFKNHTESGLFEVDIVEPDGATYSETASVKEGTVSVRIPFGEEDPGSIYKASILGIYGYLKGVYSYSGDGDEIQWTVPEKTVRVAYKNASIGTDPWDGQEKPVFHWKLTYDGLPVARTRVYLLVQDVNYEGEWYSVEWTRETDEEGNLYAYGRADTTHKKISIKSVGDGTMQYAGDGDLLEYVSGE